MEVKIESSYILLFVRLFAVLLGIIAVLFKAVADLTREQYRLRVRFEQHHNTENADRSATGAWRQHSRKKQRSVKTKRTNTEQVKK